MKLNNIIISLLMVSALLVTGCVPSYVSDNAQSSTLSKDATAALEHTRRINTPAYTWTKGAIVFTVSGLRNDATRQAVDHIIRMFAEHNAPLDIAVPLDIDDKNIVALSDYFAAGIIDISIDCSEVSWLYSSKYDLAEAENWTNQLSAFCQKMQLTFGTSPVACTISSTISAIDGFTALQNNGISIANTRNSTGVDPVVEPVGFNNIIDSTGFYMLPISGNISYNKVPLASSNNDTTENIAFLDLIRQSVKENGIAIVEIQADSFVTEFDEVNTDKIFYLGKLIEESQKIGEIVTFNGWNRDINKYRPLNKAPTRELPHYDGGLTVIFRLDDVSKEWYEDVDEEIIKVFKQNRVPLDCGVIAYAAGKDSFAIPWLKKYVDEGVVGISVHGYDWTYYQIDTVKSGTTADFIKYQLIKARNQYFQYFGVLPVAFTVPTDYFNQAGYQAIDEAGFRIFATQMTVEPHPSRVPVDFYGKHSKDGMYRIPTANDVCIYDKSSNSWDGVYDVSDFAKIPDFWQYRDAKIKSSPDNQFTYSLVVGLENLGVTAIGLHPSSFVDKDGKPDKHKLEQLDKLIKWVKSFTNITTFEQWYYYHTLNKDN